MGLGFKEPSWTEILEFPSWCKAKIGAIEKVKGRGGKWGAAFTHYLCINTKGSDLFDWPGVWGNGGPTCVFTMAWPK